MNKNNSCNICGREVDYADGGCALQFAFCRRHSTTLSNISFCAECYDALLKDKFKAFIDAACLNVTDVED